MAQLTAELKNEITSAVASLRNVDDGVGVEIGNSRGLWVQVVDYGEGMEYLVELNKICADGEWQPCAKYNTSSPFGLVNDLIEAIDLYVF